MFPPQRSLFCLLLLSTTLPASLGAQEKSKEEGTPAERLRPTLERGLAYLEKAGLAWMKERKCIACHHGAFMLWAHQEARQRGFTVDEKKFAAWTEEALKLYLAQQKELEKKKTGAVEATNLLLAQGGAKPADSFQPVAALLVGSQQKDGFWKYEGQGIKRPDAEGHEATTLWAVLALDSWETRDPAAGKNKELALAWLKKAPVGADNESRVLRLLIEQRYGTPERTAELTREVLARQNPDGGWSWTKDVPSDAFATGQSLYALARVGRKAEEPAMQKAIRYLLDKQRPDGSWHSPSRKPGVKDNPIAPYWGSAWATIGLLQTVAPPGVAQGAP